MQGFNKNIKLRTDQLIKFAEILTGIEGFNLDSEGTSEDKSIITVSASAPERMANYPDSEIYITFDNEHLTFDLGSTATHKGRLVESVVEISVLNLLEASEYLTEVIGNNVQIDVEKS